MVKRPLNKPLNITDKYFLVVTGMWLLAFRSVSLQETVILIAMNFPSRFDFQAGVKVCILGTSTLRTFTNIRTHVWVLVFVLPSLFAQKLWTRGTVTGRRLSVNQNRNFLSIRTNNYRRRIIGAERSCRHLTCRSYSILYKRKIEAYRYSISQSGSFISQRRCWRAKPISLWLYRQLRIIDFDVGSKFRKRGLSDGRIQGHPESSAGSTIRCGHFLRVVGSRRCLFGEKHVRRQSYLGEKLMPCGQQKHDANGVRLSSVWCTSRYVQCVQGLLGHLQSKMHCGPIVIPISYSCCRAACTSPLWNPSNGHTSGSLSTITGAHDDCLDAVHNPVFLPRLCGPLVSTNYGRVKW